MTVLEKDSILAVFNRERSSEEYYDEISKYILKMNSKVHDYEAKEIAKRLVKIEFLSKEEVLSGKYDDVVEKHLKANLMRNISVLQDGEEKKEEPLKSKKKNADIEFVKEAKLEIGTLALIFGFKFSDRELERN